MVGKVARKARYAMLHGRQGCQCRLGIQGRLNELGMLGREGR